MRSGSELRAALLGALQREADIAACAIGRHRAVDYASYCEQVGRVKGLDAAARLVGSVIDELIDGDDDE